MSFSLYLCLSKLKFNSISNNNLRRQPPQVLYPRMYLDFVNPVTEVKMPWNFRTTRMMMCGYGLMNIALI